MPREAAAKRGLYCLGKCQFFEYIFTLHNEFAHPNKSKISHKPGVESSVTAPKGGPG